ncbi:hypothetical protein EX895_006513 [Sporisorium graminicola]|uniref:Uncharacterized protein n=1 Tax=Sporisorium graminicola TaxID=280036 RepID=A0A4U7KKJ0_9BASI|nr:hypothetical protein EX895_006513 [Sporisorium graminicola]TKY84611.1 hypothetical protein EX895_006513 [Sporisorium graminicola]
MSEPEQRLWATIQNDILTFPAFVHLPISARPESQHLLTSNNVESVKCISVSTTTLPRAVYLNQSSADYETLYPRASYKSQIAFRWGISPDVIRALSVNLDGERVLIEDKDDWGDWVSTFFFRPTTRTSGFSPSGSQQRQEFVTPPVHIHVIVDVPGEQHAATTSTSARGGLGIAPSAPPAYQPEDGTGAAEQSPCRETPNASTEAAVPDPPASVNALVNNVVGTVLQTLQPQLQALPQSILSSLSASLASANPSSMHPSGNQAASPVPAPVQPSTRQETPNTTQRQSLIDGLFDELSRLRAQQPPPVLSSSSAPQPPLANNESTEAGPMDNELSQAFAEMLARQRCGDSTSTSTASAASAADAAATAHVPMAEEDDESLTIVSTPSSSRRSSRSNSRSRGGRRAFISSTTVLLLTLVTCILGFVAPVSASPRRVAALNPRDAPTLPVEPRQNSRHLHLCKCTCFQTNSTLVPLYSPKDPSNPCLTCTRQFCLDQGLDICKGAKLEHTDHDVGTGLEGDVWAKCFERDSYKDQSIITLYILVVLGLVAFAAMRGRMEGWYQQYQTMGPQGLYNAVRESPWTRTSR